MYIKDNNQSKESVKNSYLIMKYENLFVYHCLKLAFAVFNFEVIKTTKYLESPRSN